MAFFLVRLQRLVRLWASLRPGWVSREGSDERPKLRPAPKADQPVCLWCGNRRRPPSAAHHPPPPAAAASMAAPPGPAEPSPSAANRAGLWRQNSELRERCLTLEQEVQTLRRAAAARRLSSRSSGLSPAASSLGLDRTSLSLDRSSSSGGAPGNTATAAIAAAAATTAAQALEQQLAEARREAAVAAAGIAALTSRLSQQQLEAEQLRTQLGAAQGSLAEAEAEAARRADMAEATAERVRALEAQVSQLLQEAAAAEARQEEEPAVASQAASAETSASTAESVLTQASPLASPRACPASRAARSPRGGYASSPREYGGGALPLQASPTPSQHATRIFNVTLPADEEASSAELRCEVGACKHEMETWSMACACTPPLTPPCSHPLPAGGAPAEPAGGRRGGAGHSTGAPLVGGCGRRLRGCGRQGLPASPSATSLPAHPPRRPPSSRCRAG